MGVSESGGVMDKLSDATDYGALLQLFPRYDRKGEGACSCMVVEGAIDDEP